MGAATPALAEEGDYSWWQTLINLISPPPADNPVTPEQRQASQYPLLGSGSGGFDPRGYYNWQTVQLGAETGAVCGDGSPYKFFVNRVPNSTNTVIWMEGGGALWSDRSYAEQWSNTGGIPDDYLAYTNPTKSLQTPFVTRAPVFDWVKTQNWNIVYVPYCTGDNYTGDRVALYKDAAGQPAVYHHNGLRNMRAITAWLKNNLPRPAQLLSTGCSAGGAGSTATFSHVRRDIAPNRGFLISDSGPLAPAPRKGDPQQYPSVPLHNAVRRAWGMDEGPLPYLASDLPALDTDDMGTLYTALSQKLPKDRLGYAHFWHDLGFSWYAYPSFFPKEFQGLKQGTEAFDARLLAKWSVDTARQRDLLNTLPNFGGYFPQYRDFNSSHCATLVDFRRGDIQEQGTELRHFIDSVLDGQGPVLDASENSDAADKARPADPLYSLLQTLF